jgi:hypothetical protein
MSHNKSDPQELAFWLDKSALMSYLAGQDQGHVVERIFTQCKESGCKVKVSAADLLETYGEVSKRNPDLLEDTIALIDQLPLMIESLNADNVASASKMLADNPSVEPRLAFALCMAGRDKATLISCEQSIQGFENILCLGPKE